MGALATGNAIAHPKDMTLSTLHFSQEGMRIETILPDSFVAGIAQTEGTESLTEVAASAYRIDSESGPCTISGEPRAWRLNDISARRYVVDYTCPEFSSQEFILEYTLAARSQTRDKAHENFITVVWPGQSQNAVLTLSNSRLSLPVKTFIQESERSLPKRLSETGIATPNTLDFIWLGTRHILSGLDHVVFLIGLFLISMGWTALLAVVSAFTVGHSVTLGLSTLGLYSPAPWIAEVVIAVSIIYLGIENLYALLRRDPSRTEAEVRRLTRRRWAVAGLFGLMHGFGFSYVLRDLGLPENAQFSSLLGFNLGVEIGQLLIVATLVPILAWLWRRLGDRAVSIPVSLTIVALGSWWLVERIGLK